MEKEPRKLLLVRHAEAETSGYESDVARQLTVRGRHDSYNLGVYIRDHDLVPDIALCSPSVRTRQTLHGVLESSGIDCREYPEGLYDASAGHLYEWVRGIENRHKTVMIIGHNPGIHLFARSLTGTLSVTSADRFISYPQGTLTVFECSCNDWRNIAAGQNEMTGYLRPENYSSLVSGGMSAASS